MRHHRRPLLLLIIGVISFIALCGFIYFVPPTNDIFPAGALTGLPFSLEKVIGIPPLVIFFVLLGIFVFSFGSYLFKSKKHATLLACFITIYLIFRLSHLDHPFFLILLLALFFVLELFISNKNNGN